MTILQTCVSRTRNKWKAETWQRQTRHVEAENTSASFSQALSLMKRPEWNEEQDKTNHFSGRIFTRLGPISCKYAFWVVYAGSIFDASARAAAFAR